MRIDRILVICFSAFVESHAADIPYTVSAFAGSGAPNPIGIIDGEKQQAQFVFPWDIHPAPSRKHFFVIDDDDFSFLDAVKVRKVTLDAIVTTVGQWSNYGIGIARDGAFDESGSFYFIRYGDSNADPRQGQRIFRVNNLGEAVSFAGRLTLGPRLQYYDWVWGDGPGSTTALGTPLGFKLLTGESGDVFALVETLAHQTKAADPSRPSPQAPFLPRSRVLRKISPNGNIATVGPAVPLLPNAQYTWFVASDSAGNFLLTERTRIDNKNAGTIWKIPVRTGIPTKVITWDDMPFSLDDVSFPRIDRLIGGDSLGGLYFRVQISDGTVLYKVNPDKTQGMVINASTRLPIRLDVSNYNMYIGESGVLYYILSKAIVKAEPATQLSSISVSSYSLFPPEVEVKPEVAPNILRFNAFNKNQRQNQGLMIKIRASARTEILVTVQAEGGHEGVGPSIHGSARPHGWLLKDPPGANVPPARGERDFVEGGSGSSDPVILRTNEAGEARLYYVAPEIAGTETITVSAGANSNTAKLAISVREPAISGKELSEDGTTIKLIGNTSPIGTFHKNSHYGTDVMYSALKALAKNYYDDSKKALNINDMSLAGGGLFDLNGRWNANSGHVGHREGIEVDIGLRYPSTDPNADFEQILKEQGWWDDNPALWTSDGGGSHFHLFLNGSGVVTLESKVAVGIIENGVLSLALNLKNRGGIDADSVVFTELSAFAGDRTLPVINSSGNVLKDLRIREPRSLSFQVIVPSGTKSIALRWKGTATAGTRSFRFPSYGSTDISFIKIIDFPARASAVSLSPESPRRLEGGWEFKLINPNQAPQVGGANVYLGRLENNTGAEIFLGNISLNLYTKVSSSIYTLDWAPEFLKTGGFIPTTGYDGPILVLKWSNPPPLGAMARGTIILKDDAVLSSTSKQTFTSSALPPIFITQQPSSQTVTVGQNVSFSVRAETAPLTYQWRINGTNIDGETTANLSVPNVQLESAGYYSTVVTGPGREVVVSTLAELVVASRPLEPSPSRLSNLSILTNINGANPALTIGSVIGGTGTIGTKPLLVRAAGPSLALFGVTGVLSNPKLEVFSGQSVVASNDDWGGTPALNTAFSQVGAFVFSSATSNDAAIFNPAMAVGSYTMQITGVGGAAGTVIAELYDASPSTTFTATTPRLVNVSVLKSINVGEVLTAGFVIAGETAKQVLIRAVGPTLGRVPFNVFGSMADPKLVLYAGSTPINSNDDWSGEPGLTKAFTATGAFGLDVSSKDAALLVTLAAGEYSVQVSGVNGASGQALIEIYELP